MMMTPFAPRKPYMAVLAASRSTCMDSMSRGLIERLHLRSRRYAIETEMLIKAAQVGARFAYVPVRTIYGEQGSHFRPVPDTFQIACAAIYYKVFDDVGRPEGGGAS